MTKKADKIDAAEKTRDERTFIEEIENDKQALQNILSRPDKMLEEKGKTYDELSKDEKKEYDLEKNTADTIKRTLQLAEVAGVQITTGDGTSVDASENGLPNASMFMHGARFKFELPAGSGHEVANYIMNGATGEEAKNTKPQSLDGGLVSKKIDGEKAQSKGKHVFTRVIATHGASFDGDTVTETKGPAEGVKAMTSQGGTHFGMNVPVGEYGAKDIHGRDMTHDGLSGHMYICYIPPTATRKGCLMVGMEGCVPPTIGQAITGKAPEGQYDSHDVSGSADDFTTHGGRPAGERGGQLGPLDARLKSEIEVYKTHDQEHPYKDTVIPRRYDGMGVPLQNNISEVLNVLKDQEIPNDIGNHIPTPTDKEKSQEVVQHQTKQDTVAKDVLNAHCPQIEDIQAKIKEAQAKIEQATKKAQEAAEKAAKAAEKASEKGGFMNKRKAKSALKKAQKTASVVANIQDTVDGLNEKLAHTIEEVQQSAKQSGVAEAVQLDGPSKEIQKGIVKENAAKVGEVVGQVHQGEDRRKNHALRQEIGEDKILTPKERKNVFQRIKDGLFGTRHKTELRETLGGQISEEQRNAIALADELNLKLGKADISELNRNEHESQQDKLEQRAKNAPKEQQVS